MRSPTFDFKQRISGNVVAVGLQSTNVRNTTWDVKLYSTVDMTRTTAEPTKAPTAIPSSPPTFAPTVVPTRFPTLVPTWLPTASPTMPPTSSPTAVPSFAPTRRTNVSHTAMLIDVTIGIDTGARTTNAPSANPTASPTRVPTPVPTQSPTVLPSFAPTVTTLYHNWTSPVPSCTYMGADDYDSTAATNDGGVFPFKAGDSLACRAWKLAATICNTEPKGYSSNTAGTGPSSWNFQCASGGFTDPRFGKFCSVSTQYICASPPVSDAAFAMAWAH